MSQKLSVEGQDLLARLDEAPITRLHVGALAICSAAFAFDLMEIAFGGALAAIFSAPPHALSAAQLSWLLSGVYIGAIVGTSTMGLIADRYGRRRVLSWLLGALAFTSMLAALARDPLELTLARGVSGVALGAFPPLMVVLLTDLLPARRRGAAIFVVCGLAYLGAPMGIFLMRHLDPIQPLGVDAWRWVFWLGTLGSAVLAWALARWVPESPRWLISKGQIAEAQRVVERLVNSPMVLKRLPLVEAPKTNAPAASRLQGRQGFTLLAVIYFLAAWSTVAFPLLSGAVMIEKGLRLSDTLLYVGIATFGPFLGNLLISGFADAVERRTALATCALMILGAMLCFMFSESGPALAASGLLVTLLSSVYVPLLNLYGAEVAEGGKRGGVVTGAWAFNRIGAALSPLLLVPLLKSQGAMSVFAVIGLSLCLSLMVLALLPQGQANRAVA